MQGQGLSARVSYVYKNVRNNWGGIDAVRTSQYTVPYTITDLGADNLPTPVTVAGPIAALPCDTLRPPV
jgi:hypothetical protein